MSIINKTTENNRGNNSVYKESKLCFLAETGRGMEMCFC